MASSSKIDEWRTMWPLPFTALFGIAGSGTIVYSTGVFMDELIREFGWSKTQFTSAMTAQLLILLIVVPLVGRAIDRFGARRVALTGIVPAIAGASMLGLANGAIWQWWLLSLIQTIGTAMIVPPVWITAVVGRFHASRGLALAVALAGTGVGTALWPMLAAQYIELFGWRLAYAALALSWGAVIVPLALFFFFDSPAESRHVRLRTAPQPFAHLLVSRTFICLALAAGLFVVASYALLVHLVPILRGNGLDLRTAAALAGVAGLCSILGRVGTGLLLDSVPTRTFGVFVFLLPAGVAVLLALGAGSLPMMIAAVALMGLAMGAESDFLAFIASRRFDHAVFGSIFSTIQTVTAVTSLSGVMLGGYLFDLWGDYSLFLVVVIPIVALSALCLALVPSAQASAGHREPEGPVGLAPSVEGQPV